MMPVSAARAAAAVGQPRPRRTGSLSDVGPRRRPGACNYDGFAGAGGQLLGVTAAIRYWESLLRLGGGGGGSPPPQAVDELKLKSSESGEERI